MKEVLADCEVEQEPGKIRIGKTFAPYLLQRAHRAGLSRTWKRSRESVHALTGAATT